MASQGAIHLINETLCRYNFLMTGQIAMKIGMQVADRSRNIVSKFEPDPRWLKKRQISKGYPCQKISGRK